MIKQQESIEKYRSHIDKILGYAYEDGYRNGMDYGMEQLENERAECHREMSSVGNDADYAKEWNDYSPLYGWCSVCGKVHSGRWAHIWEFCPWCGARINHDNDPYPLGLRMTSELQNELSNLAADINPEEIKSHDTEESLEGWCGAWQRVMEKLIKKVGESE